MYYCRRIMLLKEIHAAEYSSVLTFARGRLSMPFRYQIVLYWILTVESILRLWCWIRAKVTYQRFDTYKKKFHVYTRRVSPNTVKKHWFDTTISPRVKKPVYEWRNHLDEMVSSLVDRFFTRRLVSDTVTIKKAGAQTGSEVTNLWFFESNIYEIFRPWTSHTNLSKTSSQIFEF